MKENITGVPGFKIGFVQDREKATGVTVIFCPENAVGGIDLRGSATGTRQCDSLRPDHLVGQIHAVCLAGGSAFGLDCAAGVMKFLAEKGIGMSVGFRTVPIVPTAVIFDCALGDHEAFPSPEMAYQASQAAGTTFQSGSFGAGCGASVGKVKGIAQAMKGGQGTALKHGQGGLAVGALVVCNAYGDIYDPVVGRLIAGARREDTPGVLLDAENFLANGERPVSSFQNTVLAVVGTNARLDKAACSRVAKMAQAGLARTIRPVHALFDGDVMFAVSGGEIGADENAVGTLAAQAIEDALLDAVYNADGLGLIPDVGFLQNK